MNLLPFPDCKNNGSSVGIRRRACKSDKAVARLEGEPHASRITSNCDLMASKDPLDLKNKIFSPVPFSRIYTENRLLQCYNKSCFNCGENFTVEVFIDCLSYYVSQDNEAQSDGTITYNHEHETRTTR